MIVGAVLAGFVTAAANAQVHATAVHNCGNINWSSGSFSKHVRESGTTCSTARHVVTTAESCGQGVGTCGNRIGYHCRAVGGGMSYENDRCTKGGATIWWTESS